MVLMGIQESFQCEEAILAAECGGATKLELGAVEFEQAKCSPVHNGREDFAANIHQHNASPFVWIREVP